MPRFTKTTRGVDDCQVVWLHNEKPHWIVHYEESKHPTMTRPAFYEAFRAIHPVPSGRKPWSIDNKRFSDGNGFRTLRQAMQAAA